MKQDFAELLEQCRTNGRSVWADSRQVTPGSIFVAVPGVNDNGAKYIQQACQAGATTIVCHPDALQNTDVATSAQIVFHPDPREALSLLAAAKWHTEETPLKILAITGTNGKTTCSRLLEFFFSAQGHKVGVLGTIDYHWPGYAQPASLTTPDPLLLHKMLAQMAQDGCDIAIMEASSHALEQKRVDNIPFSGAIFTNLTQDHLDFHPTMEAYFQAKAKLFLDLPKADKAVAINTDDLWGQSLLQLCPQALSYSLAKTSPQGEEHLQGKLLSADTRGCVVQMRYAGQEWILHSPLIGAFNAANLLAVQALILKLGYPVESLQCLEQFQGVCGRMERIDNPAGLHIFVDYAHTPDALINVLKSLRQAGFARIITVFGCGGNRDKGKRPLMGEAVATYADIAIVTSDNPRFEDPEAIIQDILPGLKNARQVLIEPDRRKATQQALALMGKEDALLIAGKGHENYQIIQGVKTHYSDQEVIRDINCSLTVV